jgi:tetratricopeptide (TPR) repeat protein
MTATTADGATLALVHEGWNHLMSQRPLAAWGTWQRALRLDPGSAAAHQALETLESAPDLPIAARKVYRFRKPRGELQRSRWDSVLRDGPSADLQEAAAAFGRLTAEDPDDPDALFNQALCLAWSGQDQEAIECLDLVVRLEAEADPKAAAECWIIAEVLRQGGGAESLSDDLRYACNFAWNDEDTPRLEALCPELRRIPTPLDPSRPETHHPDLQVLEWLDRPFPAAAHTDGAAGLPRVMATVYITPDSLRLSSPRVETLEEVEEKLRRLMGMQAGPLERVAAPLPLPFLDADVWTARFPEGLDRELVHRLARDSVEYYYENQWIHRPRQGLDGLSPLAAAQDSRRGDAVAGAKLDAVIRLREQLGSRPSALAMYHGYPFDRLRRRLGLELENPDAVAPVDLSCASLPELQALSPEELDDVRLVEAFKSATGLGDDPLSSRLAIEVLRRSPSLLDQLDLLTVYAPQVRLAMQRGTPDDALELLERARSRGVDANRRAFDTWRAEILARTARPEAAASVYQELVASSPSAAQVALDAAETLLDNGHRQVASDFLAQARELARRGHSPWVESVARQLIETHFQGQA